MDRLWHLNDMVWSSFVLDWEPCSANFMRVCSFLRSVMTLYPSSFSLEGLTDGCGNSLLLSIISRSTQWALESWACSHIWLNLFNDDIQGVWNRKLSGFTMITDQIFDDSAWIVTKRSFYFRPKIPNSSKWLKTSFLWRPWKHSVSICCFILTSDNYSVDPKPFSLIHATNSNQ